MRTFVLIILLCVSAKSFGEVYRVQDRDQNCELYLSPSSIHIERFDSSELEKVSSMPALVFQKYKGDINLKGLWALTTLVDNLNVDSNKIEEIMNYNFQSVCLSSSKEIIHLESGRRLFNNLNDLDKVE